MTHVAVTAIIPVEAALTSIDVRTHVRHRQKKVSDCLGSQEEGVKIVWQNDRKIYGAVHMHAVFLLFARASHIDDGKA